VSTVYGTPYGETDLNQTAGCVPCGVAAWLVRGRGTVRIEWAVDRARRLSEWLRRSRLDRRRWHVWKDSVPMQTAEPRGPADGPTVGVKCSATSSNHLRARRRFEHEWGTVKVMIEMYCHDLHGSRGGLCEQCVGLAQYASQRLARCPFLDDKPTCARCPVHCYKPDMRAAIRAVMRYAGPRMLWRHPWLALRHMAHQWWGGRSHAHLRRSSRSASGPSGAR
jgi:hypothetical protein